VTKGSFYGLHLFKYFLGLGCLCPVVVHNDYVVLDHHTHNTFTGITILF
jgi:hypothetical protein